MHSSYFFFEVHWKSLPRRYSRETNRNSPRQFREGFFTLPSIKSGRSRPHQHTSKWLKHLVERKISSIEPSGCAARRGTWRSSIWSHRRSVVSSAVSDNSHPVPWDCSVPAKQPRNARDNSVQETFLRCGTQGKDFGCFEESFWTLCPTINSENQLSTKRGPQLLECMLCPFRSKFYA